jgi:hypothetical protein
VWLWGNAIVEYVFCLAVLVDASSSRGNVDMGIMCDVGHTVWPEEHGEREMNYLSHVVDQRPMLRVAGEILLAFCFVTPLVLLLCFLV